MAVGAGCVRGTARNNLWESESIIEAELRQGLMGASILGHSPTPPEHVTTEGSLIDSAQEVQEQGLTESEGNPAPVETVQVEDVG